MWFHASDPIFLRDEQVAGRIESKTSRPVEARRSADGVHGAERVALPSDSRDDPVRRHFPQCVTPFIGDIQVTGSVESQAARSAAETPGSTRAISAAAQPATVRSSRRARQGGDRRDDIA
jgi:hypothetical protein